jgi:ferredoxin
MTHVVTEACIQCKYTDCVSVCPVECFHEGPNFLVIDPAVCIDCGVCIPECPVEAIVDAKDLMPEHASYLALNEQLSAHWPLITQSKEPMPEADTWAKKTQKKALLQKSVETA